MSKWYVGKKVTFWYAVKNGWTKGVIVSSDTFGIMYKVDIGERVIDVHKSNLWSA